MRGKVTVDEQPYTVTRTSAIGMPDETSLKLKALMATIADTDIRAISR